MSNVIILLSVFISVAAIGMLGWVVYIKNRKSITNRTFFYFSIISILWNLSNFFVYQIDTPSISFWFIRINMFFAVWYSYFLFQFLYIFPKSKYKFSRFFKVIIYIASFTSLMTLTPLVLKKIGEITTDGQIVTIINGPAIPFFGMVTAGLIISAIVAIIKKIRHSKSTVKVLLLYVLIGTSITFISYLIFNFLLPAIFNNPSYIQLGSIFTLPLIIMTSYAIIRHQLLDIRLIVLRTITYSLLVVFISTTVVGLILLLPQTLLINNTLRIVIAIFASVFIVIILDPLKKWIGKLTDQLFYKASVDYQKLLSELSEVINREIDLDRLLFGMSRKLEHKLKIKNVSIYLAGPIGGAYYKRVGHIDPKTGKKIDDNNNEPEEELDFEHRLRHDSNIIKYLKKSKDIVVLESLERKIEDTQDDKERSILEKSKEEIDKMDAAVVAPVVVGNSLTGVMVFGPKLSGDPFGSEDINLLNLIGPQLASALEKSRLYEEAQEFTERLKKEVAMATSHLQDTNLQLQDANKHLQQLDQAKSEFVSITSHQLRTPMTGIMGYISMILQGDFGRVPKEQKKILEGLFEESQRMIRIINLFLNVSKIESGRLELNLEPTQFEDVVSKVIKMVQQPADEKKLKLIYKMPSKPLPKVMGDKDKLSDIVLNFTDNAIKYTEKGSIILETKVNGKFVQFSCHDTGRGIDPEEAKKLFTKFVRGFGIAQVNPDGSGLGLYVARRLAEAHHGKIWVDSDGLGKGSTFHVKIPIAKVEKK